MAEFAANDYTLNKNGHWDGQVLAPMTMELPFMLAAAGLGLPVPNRRLLFRTIKLHVSLVRQLIECPNYGPLRSVSHFAHVSAGLKRLASESVGLAAAGAFAEQLHGWDPAIGWPRDLDVGVLGVGSRPDLLFPLTGGQVAAECRGRSGSRSTLTAAPQQTDRMASLEAWQRANTKVFMAWAWISRSGTRVDHFDPGEVREVVDEASLAAALARQARDAYSSAREDSLDLTSTERGQVVGDWTTDAGSREEVFVGVVEPDAVPTRTDRRISSTESSTRNPTFAQVGPIVVAIRGRGTSAPIGEFLSR